ncbi:MAG: hypothetical protein KAG66_03740 [Methylococcales bacterium]|nr:hypothetical protein [Methylococcales bacterium]
MEKFDEQRLMSDGDMSHAGVMLYHGHASLGVVPDEEGKFDIEVYTKSKTEKGFEETHHLAEGFDTYTDALNELVRIVNFL